jgi:Tol biopolymer transport system component
VTDERQITGGVGVASSPVLSRNGTAIAFSAVANGYTNPQIWVGSADGSAPPRPLTIDAVKNYDPEFPPTAEASTSLRSASRKDCIACRLPAAHLSW